MDKYSVPNLPTSQHILEDLSNIDIVHLNYQLKLPLEDILQNAYTCYRNCKKLEEDLKEQSVINTQLEELNKKLIQSMSSMKKQSK